ncbi:MAG: hypothetical protein JSV31_14845 [Desulfobacterales bacterium]|nr:MAG: hypothetical protein JSV31_14845 [Desulfobacterales bacterium]
MSFEEAIGILKKHILGRSYTYMSVDDQWRLRFDNNLWHVARNIVFPEEPELNKLLANSDLEMLSGVDPEDVAKGALVLRNMRKELTDIVIDRDGTLRLSFGECEISFTTQEDIVDWQWCLNSTGNDPYSDFMIACFSAGEIEMKK